MLPDEGIALQQSTFLVLDVLRVKRSLPFQIHSLEMFAGANNRLIIAFSDTLLGLADVLFEEPLYSFRSRAFELLAINSNLQDSPQTTIDWSKMNPFPRVFFKLPSHVQLRFRLLGGTPTPRY